MSEKTASVRGSQRSSFGVIFLTIFLDMIGFSVIFPLFPEMLKHYLEREKRGEGGFVTTFVESVHGLGFEGWGSTLPIETVIFGGALGSLFAILQFIFADKLENGFFLFQKVF